MTSPIFQNPFTVQTPEGMTAQNAYELFVDVFSDFQKIPHQGHSFIHGPRGSGKSMMFRYMQPDCQILKYQNDISTLDYLGIYIPIKATTITLTDLSHLKEAYARIIFNEHMMATFFISKMFHMLSQIDAFEDNPSNRTALKMFGDECFVKQLAQCGWKENFELTTEGTLQSMFVRLTEACDSIYTQALDYLKRIHIDGNLPTYEGALCSYFEFMLPLFKGIKELPFTPNGPIYLLVDDADNLNELQTKILNSWVSSRTTSIVSLKISVQKHYKTYRTASEQVIDEPHDFTTTHISTLYTSSKETYKKRVEQIVQKRLKLAKIDATPNKFFPPDEEQEARIDQIAQEYIKNWKEEGRGNRPRDDALRYARPDYMTQLKGTSKSAPSYSYSGLNQLIHISSGIIRCFLEPASIMYDEQASQNNGKHFKFIHPRIQNSVTRKESEDIILNSFQKIINATGEDAEYDIKLRKLYNLVNSLGGVFQGILLAKGRAERRVFSFFISDRPDDEVLSVLGMGVEQGFFHLSTIGKKDGTGRQPLYVLTRRLAPHFYLDPSGFAGYQSIPNKELKDAMNDHNYVRKLQRRGIDKTFEDTQLELF